MSRVATNRRDNEPPRPSRSQAHVIGRLLAVAALVPFLPLALLTIASYRSELVDVEQEIQESNRQIAALAVTYLDTLVDRIEHEARQRTPTAALPSAWPVARWERVTEDGEVMASQLGGSRVGAPCGYSELLEARSNERVFVSPVGAWISGEPPTVLVSSQLPDDSSLVAVLDPSTLHHMLHGWSGEGVDRHVYVVDADGRPLFYSDLALSAGGASLRTNPPVRQFVAGREGQLRYQSEVSGKERLGVVQRANEADWGVVVSADEGSRLLALRSRYLGFALSIAFALGTVVAVLWWAGRRLTGPLLDIVEALQDPSRSPYAPLGVCLETRCVREYDELVRAFDELAAEIATVEQELVQAEKHAVIGQLASGLAHEMGTPLNVISGHAQYLLRKAGARDPSRSSLEQIVTQSDRIAAMIRRLLDLSRPVPARLEVVDVAEVVGQVVQLLPRLTETIQLTIDVAPDAPPALADPRLLEHALLNLVVNACQAMEDEGELRIQVAPVDGHHSQSGQKRAPMVAVRVHDSGPGVPEEHLEHLFEPFFSTRTHAGGTGLGLPIVERIVRQHGGRVEVANASSGGAVFSLTLRAASATAATRIEPGQDDAHD